MEQIITLCNGDALTIRNPRIEDAEAMIELINTVDNETRFLAREPGEFNIEPEQEREIIAQTANGRNLWLIAELNGKVIASCNAYCVKERSRLRHRAVMGITLLKQYWGMGIGRALMAALITACREMGYEQLELEVVTDNHRAIALYESCGFTNCGKLPRAFKYADGSYADFYFMCLAL